MSVGRGLAPAVFIFSYLNYFLYITFLDFSEEKRKAIKRKKSVGGNFPLCSVLRLPKSTATFFQIFVKRNLKIVSFVLMQLVEKLNLSYPLTRPTTTVGFSKQPKG